MANPISYTWNAINGPTTSPIIVNVYVIDARTLDVSFSVPMYNADALTKEKYTINNGLIVYSVSKVSETTFRLTTSKQAVGTSYTVTATGVRDIYGNIS